MSEATNDIAALPPADRALIVLNSTKTEADLRAMVEEAATIQEIKDKTGREQAHRMGMRLKTARTTIQKTGKAAREDATAFCNAVLTEEKRLIAITQAEETRVMGLRDAFDEKLEAERAAIAAERARLAAAMEEERARIAAERAELEAMRAAAAQAAADEHAQAGSETEPADSQAFQETGGTRVLELPVDEGAALQAELIGDGTETTDAPLIAGELGTVDAGITVQATDWRIRQFAMHTAAQFDALAAKVNQCGFAAFADELVAVAVNLRNGFHDDKLAQADRDALIAADNLLVDATLEAIDALKDDAIAA